MNDGEDTRDVDALPEALTRLAERKLTSPMLCDAQGWTTSSPIRCGARWVPDVPPDEPVYTEDDVRALGIAVNAAVTSADPAATRARDAGAVIVLKPCDGSTSGRMAVLRDPAGPRLAFDRRDSWAESSITDRALRGCVAGSSRTRRRGSRQGRIEARS